MGTTQSSESPVPDETRFTTADKAMHYYAKKFKTYADGKRILQTLRTQIIRIIKQKKRSESEVLEGINDLDLNIYVEDNVASCTIGNGGTLLIINIIGKRLDYEWNDTSGTMNDFSPEDIKNLKFAIAAKAC